MNLGELIDKLNAHPDQDAVFKIGFNRPTSWRGSYDELAFQPAKNVPLKMMLEEAEDCLGKTFEGYKGGSYTMDYKTPINIDIYGDWSDGGTMWGMMLELMFNQK